MEKRANQEVWSVQYTMYWIFAEKNELNTERNQSGTFFQNIWSLRFELQNDTYDARDYPRKTTVKIGLRDVYLEKIAYFVHRLKQNELMKTSSKKQIV